MDEIDFYQETLLDNYMEERVYFTDPRPFDELPTLSDWLDA